MSVKETSTLYGFEGNDFSYLRERRTSHNNIVLVFAALGKIEKNPEEGIKSTEARWAEHKLRYFQDNWETWDRIRHSDEELFDQVFSLSMRYIQLNMDYNHLSTQADHAILFKKWDALSKRRNVELEQRSVVYPTLMPLLGEACAKLEQGGFPVEAVDWLCA